MSGTSGVIEHFSRTRRVSVVNSVSPPLRPGAVPLDSCKQSREMPGAMQ